MIHSASRALSSSSSSSSSSSVTSPLLNASLSPPPSSTVTSSPTTSRSQSQSPSSSHLSHKRIRVEGPEEENSASHSSFATVSPYLPLFNVRLHREKLLRALYRSLDALGETHSAALIEQTLPRGVDPSNVTRMKRALWASDWYTVALTVSSLSACEASTQAKIHFKCAQERFREEWLRCVQSDHSASEQENSNVNPDGIGHNSEHVEKEKWHALERMRQAVSLFVQETAETDRERDRDGDNAMQCSLTATSSPLSYCAASLRQKDNEDDEDSDLMSLRVKGDWFNDLAGLAASTLFPILSSLSSVGSSTSIKLKERIAEYVRSERAALCEWLDHVCDQNVQTHSKNLASTSSSNNASSQKLLLTALVDICSVQQNRRCVLSYPYDISSSPSTSESACSLSYPVSSSDIIGSFGREEILYICRAHHSNTFACCSRLRATGIVRVYEGNVSDAAATNTLQNTPRFTLRMMFQALHQCFWHISFATDDTLLSASGSSVSIHLFRTSESEPISNYVSGHREYISASVFVSQNQALLSVAQDRFCLIHSVKAPHTLLRKIDLQLACDVVVLHDGLHGHDWACIGTQSGHLYAVDLTDDIVKESTELVVPFMLLEGAQSIISLTSSPCSQYLLAFLGRPSSLLLYEVIHLASPAVHSISSSTSSASVQPKRALRFLRAYHGLYHHHCILHPCFFGPNSHLVAVGSEDCTIHILDREKLTLLCIAQAHAGIVNAIIPWHAVPSTTFSMQVSSLPKEQNFVRNLISASDDGTLRHWQSCTEHSEECKRWNALLHESSSEFM